MAVTYKGKLKRFNGIDWDTFDIEPAAHEHYSNEIIDGNVIHYIVGDSGGVAGAWTATSTAITHYYDGLTIAFRVGTVGASTTTLNINNLGAKVCRRNTSKLTTQLPVGSVAIFVYTTISGVGYWVWADYNSNTTYAEISEAEILAGTASTARSISARRLKFAIDNLGGGGGGSSSNSYEWLEQVVIAPGYSQSITELFQNYGPGEYVFDIYTQETTEYPILVDSTMVGTIFDDSYSSVKGISFLNTVYGGQYWGHIVIKMSVTSVNVIGTYTSNTGGSDYNGVFMGNPNMETFTFNARDASNSYTIDVYKLGGA